MFSKQYQYIIIGATKKNRGNFLMRYGISKCVVVHKGGVQSQDSGRCARKSRIYGSVG